MNELIKAYVSGSALRSNLETIAAFTQCAPVCAMVKANAYGHDAAIVVRALESTKIAMWGVANIQEALELVALEVRQPVLIFQPFDAYLPPAELAEQIDHVLRHPFRVTIANMQGLQLLAQQTCRRNTAAYVHIKIDTGMGRNGCSPEDALELIRNTARTAGVRLEGIYSHFACADEESLDFARQQLSVFQGIVTAAARAGVTIPYRHMANSGATFSLPESWMDMIRPGLALYGYGRTFGPGAAALTPVMRVEAPILMTKWIRKGAYCGYGCTFVARRDTRMGLLPIGYADGYSRQWSNTGLVDIGGHVAPVIGRINMDQTVIDITDLPNADTGTAVCLISNRPADSHSVESMARRLDTIPYEITTVLGRRVRRIATP